MVLMTEVITFFIFSFCDTILSGRKALKALSTLKKLKLITPPSNAAKAISINDIPIIKISKIFQVFFTYAFLPEAKLNTIILINISKVNSPSTTLLARSKNR